MKEQKEQKNYRYQRCGGLWKKQTSDGRGYLSGRITLEDEFGISKDYSISVWPNKNKIAGDTKFDYTIDFDTQATKPSPARKKAPEVEQPQPPLENPLKEREEKLI
jgi:hypothetical protein